VVITTTTDNPLPVEALPTIKFKEPEVEVTYIVINEKKPNNNSSDTSSSEDKNNDMKLPEELLEPSDIEIEKESAPEPVKDTRTGIHKMG
jgi:hypothetical protein